MVGRIFAGTLLSIGLAHGAALAQSPGGSSRLPERMAEDVPQQIREKLTEKGFTDIEVMPGSFLVSARDRKGNPVRMLIGPHSMSVLTTGKASDEQAQAPDDDSDGDDDDGDDGGIIKQ